jgi:alkaline phosphatase D
MPYYAVWDDHEVINDFGPLTAAGLLPDGLQAFLDYNPIMPGKNTPKRLYRSIRWGKQLELFILDSRQYRDANFAGDDAAKPKTMLGREQVVWLKEELKQSNATWKVVISSVPMSIPTGAFPDAKIGRDGWAGVGNVDAATGLETGFEHELLDILKFMRDHDIGNSVWLTTDVHFAAGYRYQPFTDDAAFQVHEFASGPMSAIVLPDPGADPDLHPTQLFVHAPGSIGEVVGGSYALAKSFFNFGLVDIDDQGKLTVTIINALGDEIASETLLPKP